MTVIERLRSSGSPEDEAKCAAFAIGAAMPLDRDVRITDQVLDAALAGDITLLGMLLAEEVDPEPDEVAALETTQDNDRTRFTTAEMHSRLGL